MSLPLDHRPVLVAVAGPNGAGKTTFFHSHLQPAGLRYINADVLTRELALEPYPAARHYGATFKPTVAASVRWRPSKETNSTARNAFAAATCKISRLRVPTVAE